MRLGNCEFCRMHGVVKKAHYVLLVDDIEWELCYDCMMEETIRGEGKIIKSDNHIYKLAIKMAKEFMKENERSSNKKAGAVSRTPACR